MEIPTITGSSYATSTADIGQLMLGHARGIQPAVANPMQQFQDAKRLDKWMAEAIKPQPVKPTPKETPMSTARIVKVYIADSNENLPLDKRVLYTGDEKLTDLTDQELFFEIPIAELLTKHNAVRAATVDKKQAEKFGRDIFLEPARIRDLRMVVVNVATF